MKCKVIAVVRVKNLTRGVAFDRKHVPCVTHHSFVLDLLGHGNSNMSNDLSLSDCTKISLKDTRR